MHHVLFRHIEERINDATASVLRYMPIGLSPDEIYEDMIGNTAKAEAFANAVQYLPPTALSRRLCLETEEYGLVRCHVRLPSTPKYPSYLFPLFLPELTRQSKLSQALALPLRVARDWGMLGQVFLHLAEAVDVRALACIMPWIRELVADWERMNPRPRHPYKPNKERRSINQEIDEILSERPPNRFPRLTESLNHVCLSGKALFSQYRMLAACNSSPVPSMVIVDRQSLMPDWLQVHLLEVLTDWRDEQIELSKQMDAR